LVHGVVFLIVHQIPTGSLTHPILAPKIEYRHRDKTVVPSGERQVFSADFRTRVTGRSSHDLGTVATMSLLLMMNVSDRSDSKGVTLKKYF
jgi:hypothetical protein